MFEDKNEFDGFDDLDEWDENPSDVNATDLEVDLESEDPKEPEKKAKEDPKPKMPKKKTKKKVEAPDDFDDLANTSTSLDVASDVPVTVTAVIGKTSTNVRELLDYKSGTIIDLHRSPGETVDIVAGGKLIARGELVDMDGKLGVRILKMLR